MVNIRFYDAHDGVTLKAAFGQMLEGMPLPELTEQWTLTPTFAQVQALIQDTIQRSLQHLNERTSSTLDIILGQRAKPHPYTHDHGAEIHISHAGTVTLTVFLYAFNAVKLRGLVAHETLHFMRFNLTKQLQPRLLDTALEEGMAEELALELYGEHALGMGLAPFDDPGDLIKLWYWQAESPNPGDHPAGDESGRRQFLMDHRHYATGYHIIRTVVNSRKWTLPQLLRRNTLEIWSTFLELQPEVRQAFVNAK